MKRLAAQNLAALAMNLSLIRKAGASLDPKAKRRIKDSETLAQQACREIRTLSYLLHPPELEDGDLWSAVRWYTEGFSNRSGIRSHCARGATDSSALAWKYSSTSTVK